MQHKKQPQILRQLIHQALEEYFSQLGGHNPNDLYQLVMQEVEHPLLEQTLKYTQNNQSLAANILGISRGTLRKKLKQHNS